MALNMYNIKLDVILIISSDSQFLGEIFLDKITSKIWGKVASLEIENPTFLLKFCSPY